MFRGSGITRVNSTTHGPVLIRAANNALIYPEQLRHAEQEALFSHSQLRGNGVQVEDCPQKYGGAQCLILDHDKKQIVLPLSYDKGITTLNCNEPTDKEISTLPIIDIIDPTGVWHPHNVGKEEFDVQLCNKVLSLRQNRRAKATHRKPGSHWDASDITLWQTSLGYSTEEVVKRTLKATTQMVDLEENRASYTVMRDNFQKRFPGYGCKRVQDTAFVDLFQPTKETGKTIRGYKYYMLIALNGNKTVHGYGLKSKVEAPAMLATYFKDVCVPTTAVTDGAGELYLAEWKEVLRIFVCKDGTTEAYHQNQNFAERNIETIKHMAHKVFDQSGAPTKLWCFAVDYAIDLWNHLAHSGNWRTPIERLLG